MNPQQAIAAVSLATGTPEEVIAGPERTQEAVRCRLMVMHLLKQARPMMKPHALALAVNRLDPLTGREGLKKAKELIESDPTFAAALERAGERLNQVTT